MALSKRNKSRQSDASMLMALSKKHANGAVQAQHITTKVTKVCQWRYPSATNHDKVIRTGKGHSKVAIEQNSHGFRESWFIHQHGIKENNSEQ
jgi:hypothetical protein